MTETDEGILENEVLDEAHEDMQNSIGRNEDMDGSAVSEAEENRDLLVNEAETQRNTEEADTDRLDIEIRTDTEKEVCWYYKNRKCRFEGRCRDAHPTKCRTIVETGVCGNKICKYFHPKMCNRMLHDGRCNRINCWFTHPTRPVQIQRNTSDGNNRGPRPNNNNDRNSFGQMPPFGRGEIMRGGIGTLENRNNNIWPQTQENMMGGGGWNMNYNGNNTGAWGGMDTQSMQMMQCLGRAIIGMGGGEFTKTN